MTKKDKGLKNSRYCASWKLPRVYFHSCAGPATLWV